MNAQLETKALCSFLAILPACDDDGNVTESTGEAHFAWVLKGRAVQDVFINPRRSDRGPQSPKFANWYGTTIRIYDPSIVAGVLVQPSRRHSRRIDRTPRWPRHCAGRKIPGRHIDPVDF